MEAGRNGPDSTVEVELRGLSIYTHHGVTDAEQEVGQRLEIDVTFDVPDPDAVLTDSRTRSTTRRSATSWRSPQPSAAIARSSAWPM